MLCGRQQSAATRRNETVNSASGGANGCQAGGSKPNLTRTEPGRSSTGRTTPQAGATLAQRDALKLLAVFVLSFARNPFVGLH